ncbi:MAG: hypothetical protein HUK22_05285 [Thermoguttaceae bacterium]|nr:hypothetical protein [Thermoguttaceae bacterium]
MQRDQGVIITLIVFIVLSLGLGVSTYFGFKGLSEKKQELAQANTEKSNLTSENTKLNGDLKKIKDKLAPGGYEGQDGAAVVDAMTASIASLVSDGGVAANVETYEDALNGATTALVANQATIAQLEAEVAAQTAAAKEEARKTADLQAQFDKDLQTKQAEFDKSVAAARNQYDALNTQFVQKTQEFDTLKSETEDAIAEANQKVADAEEIATKIGEINVDLSAKIDELSRADFSEADASVLYADQVNKRVRLNIGSADGISPRVTFNVFPSDALDVGTAKSKGIVEVVEILDAHTCEARICEDEMSNPVMPGDLVYTPLWRRGSSVKYALDFRLDVDGDGKSDFEELRYMLESIGAEVVAYIDDNGVANGKITPDVFRVVVADEAIDEVLARDVSFDDETKKRIQTTQANFLAEARQNSVKQITLTDLLHRVGYTETALITRFKDANARVPFAHEGIPQPVVSTSPVAPIYTNDKTGAKESTGVVAPKYGVNTPVKAAPGVVAPIYKDGAQPVGPAIGETSDYHFRQRQPRPNK